MIYLDDIIDYWKQSELANITDYNEDSVIDDEVIEHSIEDAYRELSAISEILTDDIMDLYAKQLTICSLITRLNINPEAVELPLADCGRIRELIKDVLDKKAQALADNEADKVDDKSRMLLASKGITEMQDILVNY